MNEFIIAVISLILSFFFSGTETAFVSVNKIRVEIWHKQGIRGAGIIRSFVSHPEKFLYTTLVGTNISNIACATYGTLFFMNYLQWSPQATWLMMTLSILFLGEIIPKYIFRNFADFFVRKIAIALHFFYLILYPAIAVSGFFSTLVLGVMGYKKSKVDTFFSRTDMEILLRERNQNPEVMENTNREFLRKVLDFKLVKVRDAMIPRADIVAVDKNISISALKKIFISSGRTRIPVYDDKLDDILGVVYLKDIFKNPANVKEILHEIIFIPEFKNVDDLLKDFQKTNQSIAIVVDEYGGTEGLVTTEDLVEVIIGEIQDEYDQDIIYIKKTGPDEWRVHARTEIEQFNETLGEKLPQGDYDTIGGFLLSHFGHIPKKDESLEINNIKYTVTKSTTRHIEWLKVKKLTQ